MGSALSPCSPQAPPTNRLGPPAGAEGGSALTWWKTEAIIFRIIFNKTFQSTNYYVKNDEKYDITDNKYLKYALVY